jgi:hypothetical protein
MIAPTFMVIGEDHAAAEGKRRAKMVVDNFIMNDNIPKVV